MTFLAAVAVALIAPQGGRLTGKMAPSFQVRDGKGQIVTPRSLRGAPSVLMVFCSCSECRRVATAWGRLQAKAGGVAGKTRTLVCYTGPLSEARTLVREVGMRASTVLLDDPKMVIAQTYRAMPCPSIFVLDRNGGIRYSSKETAGELVSDADTLVSQTLTALGAKPTKVAQTASSATPRPTLVGVQPGPDTSVDATGHLDWRPNGVDLAKEQDLTRTFRFRNTTGRAVVVSRVIASCGCQSTRLLQAGAEKSKATVPPGTEVQLTVTVHLAGTGTAKRVSAWLYGPQEEVVGAVRIQVGPP